MKNMNAEQELLQAIFGSDQSFKNLQAQDYLVRIDKESSDESIKSVAYMLYDWCKVFDHEIYMKLLDSYYKEFEHIYVKADKKNNKNMKDFATQVLTIVQNVHHIIK